MPRFYFHTEDGRCMPDEEGVELPDLAAAKDQGLELLGDILKDNPAEFWGHQEYRIYVGATPDPSEPLYTIVVRGYGAQG